MAVSNWYVDAVLGHVNNGGSSTGSPKETGTQGNTNGTALVQLDMGSDLSAVVVGDAIRLSAEGGNGIRGTNVFEITSVNDGLDRVNVTPTPGTNAEQIWLIGGAFTTIQRGADVVQAGEAIHVKASTNYGEIVTLPSLGHASSYITIEGYTATPGDGGIATNDGTDSLGNGFVCGAGSFHYVLRNLRATQFTSSGFIGTASDYITLINCRGDNNGANGVYFDDNILFWRCHFHDNVDDGIKVDSYVTCIDCILADNGLDGLEANSGTVIGSLFKSNGGNGINFLLSGRNIVYNCTIDGNGKTTTVGVNLSPSYDSVQRCIVNTLVYDCTTGMAGHAAGAGKRVSSHNLVNNNTADYNNFGTDDGEQTGAPQFVNEGAGDYTLGSGSPAKNAGCDCREAPGAYNFTATEPDIGALGNVEVGSGLLMPNKRGNKQ